MIYLDSTYIVKCYIREHGTEEVLRLVESHEGRGSCLHARVEFWAAIQRQVREGGLSLQAATGVWRQFKQDEADGLWTFFSITEPLVLECCARLEAAAGVLLLRSADSLHLASAAAEGFAEIYSNDKHLLAAAPHFGLKGNNVIP